MPTFQYNGYAADQTPVDGYIDADDLKSALVALEARGLLISSIHELGGAKGKIESPLAASPSVPAEAETPALRIHLNRILKTGQPLVSALLAYAEELPPGRRRRRLKRIAHQLEQGHHPNQQLAAGHIDEEWIPLLIAGASSNEPNLIASQIIDEVQRAGDFRERLASTLAYPLTMVAVSSAIMLFISLWIVPTFRELFEGFELELPLPTYLVLSISQAIREFWWVIVLLGLLLATILASNSKLRDWIIVRVPVLGAAVRLSDRAKFARYLADLMEAGVPVTDALRLCGGSASQPELRLEAYQLATAVAAGNMELYRPFGRSVPRTLIHALQLRTNTRAAAQLLRALSWSYDQETRVRLAWISSMAEPILIVFLGMAVGFYVIALFMPFVTLIQQLT